MTLIITSAGGTRPQFTQDVNLPSPDADVASMDSVAVKISSVVDVITLAAVVVAAITPLKI